MQKIVEERWNNILKDKKYNFELIANYTFNVIVSGTQVVPNT